MVGPMRDMAQYEPPSKLKTLERAVKMYICSVPALRLPPRHLRRGQLFFRNFRPSTAGYCWCACVASSGPIIFCIQAPGVSHDFRELYGAMESRNTFTVSACFSIFQISLEALVLQGSETEAAMGHWHWVSCCCHLDRLRWNEAWQTIFWSLRVFDTCK